MQLSTFIAALLVVDVLGYPLDNRGLVPGQDPNPIVETTIEVEETDFYVNDHFTSKSLTTKVTVKTMYPTVSSTPTAVPTLEPQAAVSPVSANMAPSAPTSGPASAAAPPAAESAQTLIPTSDALTVGWVDPKNNAAKFQAISIFHHNVHRVNHSAPAVTWNNTLASWAQAKSDICIFNEDTAPGAEGQGTGMNIAGGTYGSSKDLPSVSDMISGLWYNSEIDYFPGYGIADLDTTGSLFQHWGHFTQVVWPTTKQIGCGITDCGDHWFGACLYGPTGNWIGEFGQVHPPKGFPVVYPNGKAHL